MSIPSNSSSGGYSPPYGSAPPRKAGVSGWKIAGFGCLALFLLAAVGGVLLVRAAKDQMAHPSKNSLLGTGILAGKATVDGIQLAQAIAAYHQEKGQYPQSLLPLVAEGRVDGKLLHNDLDNNPSPGHVSWRYTKPAEGAPGDTPVLEEPYTVTLGGSSQTSRVIITLNGRSKAGSPGSPPEQTP